MSDPDRDDQLILAAAAMFHAAAMQQLGKLVDPATGLAHVDLEQARLTIDIIGALRAKTEGRLHADAATELDRLLFQLRMGYVDEARREQATGEAAGKAAAESPAGASDAGTATPPSGSPAAS
jgi:hypothetical protein